MKKFVLFEHDQYGAWNKLEDFDSWPSNADILHYAADDHSEYFVFEVAGKFEVTKTVIKVEQ